jgi:hypothetical protein
MSTSARCLVGGFNVYHALREIMRNGDPDCRWQEDRPMADRSSLTNADMLDAGIVDRGSGATTRRCPTSP